MADTAEEESMQPSWLANQYLHTGLAAVVVWETNLLHFRYIINTSLLHTRFAIATEFVGSLCFKLFGKCVLERYRYMFRFNM